MASCSTARAARLQPSRKGRSPVARNHPRMLSGPGSTRQYAICQMTPAAGPAAPTDRHEPGIDWSTRAARPDPVEGIPETAERHERWPDDGSGIFFIADGPIDHPKTTRRRDTHHRSVQKTRQVSVSQKQRTRYEREVAITTPHPMERNSKIQTSGRLQFSMPRYRTPLYRD